MEDRLEEVLTCSSLRSSADLKDYVLTEIWHRGRFEHESVQAKVEACVYLPAQCIKVKTI